MSRISGTEGSDPSFPESERGTRDLTPLSPNYTARTSTNERRNHEKTKILSCCCTHSDYPDRHASVRTSRARGGADASGTSRRHRILENPLCILGAGRQIPIR